MLISVNPFDPYDAYRKNIILLPDRDLVMCRTCHNGCANGLKLPPMRFIRVGSSLSISDWEGYICDHVEILIPPPVGRVGHA